MLTADAWLAGLHQAAREEAEQALSAITCPYYRGHGICASGCSQEPACEVDAPTEGWLGLLAALGAPSALTGGERTSPVFDDRCERSSKNGDPASSASTGTSTSADARSAPERGER